MKLQYVKNFDNLASTKEGHWIIVCKFTFTMTSLKPSEIDAAQASNEVLGKLNRNASAVLAEIKERKTHFSITIRYCNGRQMNLSFTLL